MDRPIVLLTAAFTIGIITAKAFLSLPLWLICIFLVGFFLLAAHAFIKNINSSSILLILCFLAGIFSFQIHELGQKDKLAALSEKGYVIFVGSVDDQPRIKHGSVIYPLKLENGAGRLFLSIKGSDEAYDYGDRLKVRGTISQFQSFANPLMPQREKMYAIRAAYYEKIGGGGNPLKKAAIWFSRRFNSVLEQILPQKEASLLGSILLGTSVSPLPDDLKDTYRKAGLIHLLVVSGTQVSILIGICLGLTKAAGLPNWLGVLATSFFNLMLVIVTGGGASILRAGFMGEVMLIGLLFDRQKEFYTTLSLSALVLLIIDPSTLFDLGFQLSFAATWALVYIAPVFEKKMPRLLAVTLAPMLATAPIIAYNFSQVAFGGIISNLLVLPWVEFLVILGFSTTLLGFIFLPLAQILGNTIWLLLVLLDRIANFVTALPGAQFYVYAPTIYMIAGYYLALIAATEVLRREGKLFTAKKLAFALILFIAVSVWDRAFSAPALGGRELVVTFLDVGQGDCALIETPDSRKILIDGGGMDIRETGYQDVGIRGSGDQERKDKIGEQVVVPFLHRKGINKLDMVILTHPHADHLGGLIPVLGNIPVDEVLDSGQIYDSRAYKRFLDLVEANKIKYSIAQAGQTIDFGGEVSGYIYNPIRPFLERTNSDPNNNSIVMRLVYGDISFLFTGDMESEGEERVLRSTVYDLRSTILKVGHHGSRTSTSDEFLKAVSPQFAVISVGRHNKYRHPARSTLEKLEAIGADVYRTDEDGAIEIRTDGRTIVTARQK